MIRGRGTASSFLTNQLSALQDVQWRSVCPIHFSSSGLSNPLSTGSETGTRSARWALPPRRESSTDTSTIAFRHEILLGNKVRLHETALWVEQRTRPHSSKLSLSESTSNPTSSQLFLIFFFIIDSSARTKDSEYFQKNMSYLWYVSDWRVWTKSWQKTQQWSSILNIIVMTTRHAF